MDIQSDAGMGVDAFLIWAEDRPGRYELVDGKVRKMPPQQVRHVRTRFTVQRALQSAIRTRGLACRMMPSGPIVRVGPSTAYEPDAMVYDGRHLDEDSFEIPEPIIVVEVLSPETEVTDATEKLTGYFRLTSISHYLIVAPKARTIVHHRRGSGAMIETDIASSGTLDLSPPGLALPLDDVFPRA